MFNYIFQQIITHIFIMLNKKHIINFIIYMLIL